MIYNPTKVSGTAERTAEGQVYEPAEPVDRGKALIVDIAAEDEDKLELVVVVAGPEDDTEKLETEDADADELASEEEPDVANRDDDDGNPVATTALIAATKSVPPGMKDIWLGEYILR